MRMRYTIAGLGFLYVTIPTQPYVPWVPTRDHVIDKIFRIAKLGKNDVFYDLGCGDGRVAIEAAKRYGVKSVCIEIRKDLIEKARKRVREEGLEDFVEIIHGNFFEIPLREATVVYMYLLTSVNNMLKPKLKRELRVGTRIITLDFEIPGWSPVHVDGNGTWQGTIYLYVRGISDIHDQA